MLKSKLSNLSVLSTLVMGIIFSIGANAAEDFNVNPNQVSFWLKNEYNPLGSQELYVSAYDKAGKSIITALLTDDHPGYRKVGCEKVRMAALMQGKQLKVLFYPTGNEFFCEISNLDME